MKPATVQPANGETVEIKTTRRVVPAGDGSERSTPDFWQYLQSLDSKPGEWDRHIIYVYRVEPGGPGGSGVPVGKFSSVMSFPDGTTVAMSNQEEIEFGIARNYGGRTYRLIVKRGSERITQERLYIDAPTRPIIPPAEPAGATVTAMPGIPADGSIGAIAGKAIDTIAGQDHQAVRIGIEALNSAANIVRTMGQGQANPGDDMQRAFMAAMIQRMTAPPPDPLELLAKLLALQAQLNPSNGNNPIVTQIMETGLKRLLEPATNGAPAVSAGAELVRSLPSVAGYVVDGLREWRIGMEAQRDGVAMMSHRPPGAPGATAAPPAQVLPPPSQAQPARNPAPPAPPNGAHTVEPPSLEFIETRIVELLRAPMSAEEAADQALNFLHMMEGENPPPGLQYVAQLTSLGETGLLQLFSARQILKPATGNMPRLLEFIRAFLKLHAEDKAQEEKEAQERKPN